MTEDKGNDTEVGAGSKWRHGLPWPLFFLFFVVALVVVLAGFGLYGWTSYVSHQRQLAYERLDATVRAIERDSDQRLRSTSPNRLIEVTQIRYSRPFKRFMDDDTGWSWDGDLVIRRGEERVAAVCLIPPEYPPLKSVGVGDQIDWEPHRHLPICVDFPGLMTIDVGAYRLLALDSDGNVLQIDEITVR